MTRQTLSFDWRLSRPGVMEQVGVPFEGHVRRLAKVKVPDSPASLGSGEDRA